MSKNSRTLPLQWRPPARSTNAQGGMRAHGAAGRYTCTPPKGTTASSIDDRQYRYHTHAHQLTTSWQLQSWRYSPSTMLKQNLRTDILSECLAGTAPSASTQPGHFRGHHQTDLVNTHTIHNRRISDTSIKVSLNVLTKMSKKVAKISDKTWQQFPNLECKNLN